jgi:hypothetical protein
MIKAASFPRRCHLIFDLLNFLAFELHFVLDPDPDPDPNQDPEPNFITVPVSLKQKVPVPVAQH